MLTAWLQNTLDAPICSKVPLTDNVKNMWDDLQKRFQLEMIPKSMEIAQKALLAKERDDEYTHQFLIGSDTTKFSHVQSNMSMQDPLSSISIVFSKAITEKHNLALILSNGRRIEAVGFTAQVPSQNCISKSCGFVQWRYWFNFSQQWTSLHSLS